MICTRKWAYVSNSLAFLVNASFFSLLFALVLVLVLVLVNPVASACVVVFG